MGKKVKLDEMQGFVKQVRDMEDFLRKQQLCRKLMDFMQTVEIPEEVDINNLKGEKRELNRLAKRIIDTADQLREEEGSVAKPGAKKIQNKGKRKPTKKLVVELLQKDRRKSYSAVEIAELLKLNRPSVATCLNGLKKEGVVKNENRKWVGI